VISGRLPTSMMTLTGGSVSGSYTSIRKLLGSSRAVRKSVSSGRGSPTLVTKLLTWSASYAGIIGIFSLSMNRIASVVSGGKGYG